MKQRLASACFFHLWPEWLCNRNHIRFHSIIICKGVLSFLLILSPLHISLVVNKKELCILVVTRFDLIRGRFLFSWEPQVALRATSRLSMVERFHRSFVRNKLIASWLFF